MSLDLTSIISFILYFFLLCHAEKYFNTVRILQTITTSSKTRLHFDPAYMWNKNQVKMANPPYQQKTNIAKNIINKVKSSISGEAQNFALLRYIFLKSIILLRLIGLGQKEKLLLLLLLL